MSDWTSGFAARPQSTACFGEILRARVYDTALRTPLDSAPRLSKRLDNRVYFKREDLQPVFSFKVRGAQNKLAQLCERSRPNGVICSSAGNHAQGVTLAAQYHRIRAVVVMPVTTPQIKVDAVSALGAEVFLEGLTYDDATEHALRIAADARLQFIHAFSDPAVIAGQGTIGVELASQWTEQPAAVFVPVGGGGLIAGIASYLKNVYPEIRIIGVEPIEAASMSAAMERGSPVTLERIGIFADGVAVRRVSDLTLALAQEVVDEILTVDTDEICAAIKDIFEDSRVVTEPAGALAVAGMKRYVETHDCRGECFITINSGANMNFDRLRHVSERAEIGEHRESVVAVEIPEQTGAFLEFCEQIGTRNITEFNYRFAHSERAQIFVGLSVRNARTETRKIVEHLTACGYRVHDLSANELAKLHIRHMVGGRGIGLHDELVFRFEFPERPGALLAFLRAICSRWNISLFHYRNHGSDYGRVLAGVQVPPRELDEFKGHLDQLGYPYWEETNNPAYRLFLE
jgi:threonine dehydratase